MKYIVWFSWWIDSTFVAWYLKKQWHNILLINIKNTQEQEKNILEKEKIEKIADYLKLKLKIVDATSIFKKLVIDDFINSYINWKTPNPCIKCNELVRFKILNEIKNEFNSEYIATWHYVKKFFSRKNNFYSFSISYDTYKDQSYMLYRLIKFQNIMKYLKFPLWNFKKSYIKNILKNEWIPINTSKESQNICFIPDNDYPRFIRQNTFVNLQNWKILDTKWNYLWEHNWLLYYTIWQRKWLSLNTNKKKYVVKIDRKNNVLIVWDNQDLMKKEVEIEWEILLINNALKIFKNIYWKIRYKANLEKVNRIVNNKIIFENPVRAVTPWQHIVLYWKKNWKFIVIWWWVIKT